MKMVQRHNWIYLISKMLPILILLPKKQTGINYVACGKCAKILKCYQRVKRISMLSCLLIQCDLRLRDIRGRINFMKKTSIMIGFVLLLIVQGMSAMDTPIIRYNPTDEQCLRVARYIALRKTQADQIVQQHMYQKTHDVLMLQHPVVQKVNIYLKTIDKDADKAIAFLQGIPSMKMCDFISELDTLDENVFKVARLLSQSNMIVFASYNKDVFTALYNNYLP